MAGFDFRQIKDVFDDRQQMPAGAVDPVEALHLRRGHAGGAQQVAEADDGVHRRPDFVAHVGEKGALGAAGALRLYRRRDQRTVGRFKCGGAFEHAILEIGGELPNMRFAAFAFGDVAHDADRRAATGRYDARLEVALTAACLNAENQLLHPATGKRLADRLQEKNGYRPWQHFGKRASDPVSRRQQRQRRIRRVHGKKLAAFIVAENEIGNGVDQRLIVRFGDLQRRFDAHPFGDVGYDENDADYRASAIANRRGAVGDAIFVTVTGAEHAVRGQTDDGVAHQGSLHRVGQRLPAMAIDDIEHTV